jgi:hypothetical protein
MAVIDMEERFKLKDPTVLDIVYKNTWGELFTELYDYEEGLVVLKEYLKDLQKDNLKNGPPKINLHVPASARELDLARDFYSDVCRELGLEQCSEENYSLGSMRELPYSAFLDRMRGEARMLG